MSEFLINPFIFGTVVAFETVIEALSPIALYEFRDANFSTIADSSGNGFNLSPDYATAARSGSPIRAGHPGGAVFPSVSGANWPTTGVTYAEGSNGVNVALDGATGLTVVFSVRFVTEVNYTSTLIGLMDAGVTQNYDKFEIRHAQSTTGGGSIGNGAGAAVHGQVRTTQPATSYATLNGELRSNLFVLRWSATDYPRLRIVDPLYSPNTTTDDASLTLSGTLETDNGSILTFNGRRSATWWSHGFVLDHVSIFDYDIGDDATTDIVDAWLAEVL